MDAVNVFASFVTTTAECVDKYAEVTPKLERDFETETNALQVTESGALAETYAACVDGMAAGMFPCEGVDLLSHVSQAELGTSFNNDIWGWTDPDTGKEYALVGASNGTVMVDVTDPRAPVVQGILPTASTQGGSSWRDIKVYADHAFIVSEHTNHGVQVFDLTDLRDWDGTYTTYQVVARYTGHGSAHNIYINEDTGFLYSVGAGAFSGAGLPNIVTVASPSSAAGTYQATGAAFGPAPTSTSLTGPLAVVNSSTGVPSQGCGPLVDFPAGAIAVADRGGCNFAIITANAQAAGAIAVVVVNNVAGAPITMGGDDPSITIPAVMVSQADGNAIKAGLPASGGVSSNPAVINCGTGLHMIDINDPANPTYAGCFQDHGYVHDTQCVIYEGPDAAYHGRELCFNSNATSSGAGGLHRVAVVDVTDKSNPVALSRVAYPNDGYSHQGWLTEDQRFFIHGDELDEQRRGIPTTTRVWDVSDVDNPVLHQVFEYGTTSIDHNVYTEGRTATASNYTTGLRVLDAGDVANKGISQTGFFDLYPENDNATFEGGTWSNYPWYDQPNVVAVNSIDRGLFMLDITSAKINALEDDLQDLLGDGAITDGLADKIAHNLATGDARLKLPGKELVALSNFDRAVHLLLWQADVIENSNKPNQGDADALRGLAAAIQEFLEDYR